MISARVSLVDSPLNDGPNDLTESTDEETSDDSPDSREFDAPSVKGRVKYELQDGREEDDGYRVQSS